MGFFDQTGQSRRLLLLSCSQRKLATTGAIPARQRYNGPLWQTLRLADPTNKLAACAALSAWHGLLVSSTPTASYDYMMNQPLVDRVLASPDPLDFIWPSGKTGGMPGSSLTRETIRLLTRDKELPFHEVALAGGALYQDVMRAFLAAFRAQGFVIPNPTICVINGRISEMRRDLKNWLLKKE